MRNITVRDCYCTWKTVRSPGKCLLFPSEKEACAECNVNRNSCLLMWKAFSSGGVELGGTHHWWNSEEKSVWPMQFWVKRKSLLGRSLLTWICSQTRKGQIPSLWGSSLWRTYHACKLGYYEERHVSRGYVESPQNSLGRKSVRSGFGNIDLFPEHRGDI